MSNTQSSASATILALVNKEVERLVRENFGRYPRNDEWADKVLDLRDGLESPKLQSSFFACQPQPNQDCTDERMCVNCFSGIGGCLNATPSQEVGVSSQGLASERQLSEIELVLTDPDTVLSEGARRALLWLKSDIAALSSATGTVGGGAIFAGQCPNCRAALEEVKQDENSMLNAEQFDSAKLGDWFCRACPPPGKRYRYFWNNQLTFATAAVSGHVARDADLTPIEKQAILETLEIDHNGTDFEAECPLCTAYRKLSAAINTPPLPGSGK